MVEDRSLKMTSQQPWVSTLRASLKQEHGFGWGIREKQGKVQLTRRFDDGSRSSVTLGVNWDSRCLSEVMGLVSEIRQRMETQQMGLSEAYTGAPHEATAEEGAGLYELLAEMVATEVVEGLVTSGRLAGTTGATSQPTT